MIVMMIGTLLAMGLAMGLTISSIIFLIGAWVYDDF